jgi:hypothetical protein
MQTKVFKNGINKKGNTPKKKKFIILIIFFINVLII